MFCFQFFNFPIKRKWEKKIQLTSDNELVFLLCFVGKTSVTKRKSILITPWTLMFRVLTKFYTCFCELIELYTDKQKWQTTRGINRRQKKEKEHKKENLHSRWISETNTTVMMMKENSSICFISFEWTTNLKKKHLRNVLSWRYFQRTCSWYTSIVSLSSISRSLGVSSSLIRFPSNKNLKENKEIVGKYMIIFSILPQTSNCNA